MMNPNKSVAMLKARGIAYDAGKLAYWMETGRDNCPYIGEMKDAWTRGWDAGAREFEGLVRRYR
jgi:hypothetical protein